jgi:hypothetical protein
MTFLDSWKALQNTQGGNSRDALMNGLKNTLAKSFKDSPSYYSVSINGATTDVHIVDDSDAKEQKLLLTQSTSPLNAGDLVLWNGEYWLTLIVDDMGDGLYYRGTIKKCPSSLKWLDEEGEIKEAWFIISSQTQRGLGLNDGNIIILPNERRYIAVQKNAVTLKIVKGQRFILDNGRAWRVSSVNTLETGLINIELEETQLNPSIDNVTLRVANYYTHTYSISILNGNNISLTTGSTLQLNAQIKDEGNFVNMPLNYQSSDTSIATVNANGLVTGIANGSVTITASLVADPTITTTVNVNVQSVVTNNFVLTISGSDYCKVTTSQVYTGSVLNNGVVDGSKTISWSLFSDDGISATTLATITANGNNVTLKANSNSQYGYVKLVGTCVQDGSINAIKRIQIKSLI